MVVKALAVFFFTAIICSSCAEVEHSHMAQIEQMKDTVFKTYPSVTAANIGVIDESTLVITLSDQVLYDKPAAYRQQKANELGALALRLFGKDDDLKNAKLILSKDPKNMATEPADGITTHINIDSLRAAVYP